MIEQETFFLVCLHFNGGVQVSDGGPATMGEKGTT